ncbi:biotin-dependent carboxyltransferase family protein [soil metagenome]
MQPMLTVLAPGPLATVQDQGRPGHAVLGVSHSGAADRAALRLANRLVGNADTAAGVEATLGGLQVRAERDLLVALTGAAGPADIDGHPVPSGEPVRLGVGAMLRLGAPVTGLRTYLAVSGGIAVQPVLGSRATDTLSGLGPAPLTPGTRLPVGSETVSEPQRWGAVSPLPHGELRLRVVLGPRHDWFPTGAIEHLLTLPWTVQSQADRVGVRLSGRTLERHRRDELPSEGCLRGALQVITDGALILLGPDCPVTGGYPVIAVVIDADNDRGGQARPGDRIRFERA